MKKKILLTVFLCLFLTVGIGSQSWKTDLGEFLDTAISCGAGATVVYGTDWTTNASGIKLHSLGYSPLFVTITCTITRTTGAADKVHFEFQSSHDNGTTWSTDEFIKVSFPTNTDASSNVVRYPSAELVAGISHLRLYRIVNDDSATALTVCNASLSIGSK